MLNPATILSASLAVHTAIVNHEDEIESLDRAIGDGDHYINMKRATEAVANMREELSNETNEAVLQKIGMKLLSTLGGASGPLFASFFMGMSKMLKENGDDSTKHIAAAFAAGVQAIMQRGKSDAGEKTMLDVLIPVSHTFTTMSTSEKPIKEICETLKNVADEGLAATKDMIATKGRAAGLGERAIGHLDAGAKSCQVMVHTVCDMLLENAA